MLPLMAGARYSTRRLHFWDVLWCSFFPGNKSEMRCGAVSHSGWNSTAWRGRITRVIRRRLGLGTEPEIRCCWRLSDKTNLTAFQSRYRNLSPRIWAVSCRAEGAGGSDNASPPGKSDEREDACQRPDRIHTSEVLTSMAGRGLAPVLGSSLAWAHQPSPKAP